MDLATEKPCCFFNVKRCCVCVILFHLLIVAILGLLILITFFILKPQQPIFSLQAIELDAYDLHVDSGSTLFVSSVVSATLNATNPNKVAINYRPSRFYVLYEGQSLGVIRVPRFDQPAHSHNVSVRSRILLPCVNVSQIINEASSQEDDSDSDSHKSTVRMKIVGDVVAHVRVFRVTLPSVKVALDCDVSVDYRDVTFGNEFHSARMIQQRIASLRSSSTAQTFFKRCSIAFYI